jgi:sodium/proline symporter
MQQIFSSLLLYLSTNLEAVVFFTYFAGILLIAFFSYQKQKSSADFILGSRSANSWLTALSAQASDMGSWLFLAYPAMVFGGGLFAGWAAIGLTIGMFLNWHFVAPRLRIITERLGCLTLNAYFEKRFGDTSGSLRLISGIMSVLFFTFYISSGLVAMGVLVESLFGLNYFLGTAIGLSVVVIYVLTGGYRTVAWIDLFQGFFLLGIILLIPIQLIFDFGGFHPIARAISNKPSLLPDFQAVTFWKIFATAAGWGLGYFGQPHILTKFMGIRYVSEMSKAKYIGIGWQSLALGAATLIGLIGIFLFPEGLSDPQQIVLNIVKSNMTPFFAALVLCAILAATTNVMAAQILVVASNLSEDFYKQFFRKNASSEEILWVSRASVLLISIVGAFIAFLKISTIYQLVLYSWSGLGASFGPLLLLSLYIKNITKQGAFAGILAGGLTAAIWPYFDQLYGWEVASIIPGFALSLIAISTVSLLGQKKQIFLPSIESPS